MFKKLPKFVKKFFAPEVQFFPIWTHSQIGWSRFSGCSVLHLVIGYCNGYCYCLVTVLYQYIVLLVSAKNEKQKLVIVEAFDILSISLSLLKTQFSEVWLSPEAKNNSSFNKLSIVLNTPVAPTYIKMATRPYILASKIWCLKHKVMGATEECLNSQLEDYIQKVFHLVASYLKSCKIKSLKWSYNNHK